MTCTSHTARWMVDTDHPWLPQLAPDFSASVAALPTEYSKDAYARFVYKFGDAFVVSATYGGFAAAHYSYSYALAERFTSSSHSDSLLTKLDVGVAYGSLSLGFGTSKSSSSDSSNTSLTQAVNKATVLSVVGVPSLPPRCATRPPPECPLPF